jgi:hypothetical protein
MVMMDRLIPAVVLNTLNLFFQQAGSLCVFGGAGYALEASFYEGIHGSFAP